MSRPLDLLPTVRQPGERNGKERRVPWRIRGPCRALRSQPGFSSPPSSADSTGARSLAFYLVLAAIPAVAISALSFFGDLVEGSADDEAGALYVGLTGIALILLVIGAAVRANALRDAALPASGRRLWSARSR